MEYNIAVSDCMALNKPAGAGVTSVSHWNYDLCTEEYYRGLIVSHHLSSDASEDACERESGSVEPTGYGGAWERAQEC